MPWGASPGSKSLLWRKPLHWAADTAWSGSISISKQVKGEATQPCSVFRAVSLQAHSILTRAPQSNLEGLLQPCRILKIYSYIWNKLYSLKIHHEQEKKPKPTAPPHVTWRVLRHSCQLCKDFKAGQAKWEKGCLHLRGGTAGTWWAAGVVFHIALSSDISSALC